MPGGNCLSTSPVNFAAILLAGGRSTRMGVDKATMIFRGQTLWRHQLETLRASGATSIAISGPRDRTYAGAVPVIEDDQPGLGPLAGLVSALRWCSSPLLLVLAVDLPAMTPDYLARLAAESNPGCGVVPIREGWTEPLAAVYPREALALAAAHLESGDHSLQHWVSACGNAGLVRFRPVAPEELPLFLNLNTPQDVRGAGEPTVT
jgi:molybdopterin-guanine dinucleotide biosynthesis protein A